MTALKQTQAIELDIIFGACWLSEAPSTHVATYILTQDPPVVGTNHSPTYGYGF